MNSLVMIAIASAALGADSGETYADAHQMTMKTGKPMLVMVSTEWCPAPVATLGSCCRILPMRSNGPKGDVPMA